MYLRRSDRDWSANEARVIRRVPAHPDEHDCPYRAGKVYQRKFRGLEGRPAFRVTTEPRRQRLGEVTHREAQTEGFNGRRALEGFRVAWVREHDRNWHRAHPSASDERLLERWRQRHAGRDCWVLTIALIDPVRCMAEQAHILSGRTQHGDGESDQYVRSGGIDPYAEAVDASTLIRLAAQGWERQQRPSRKQRRAERRRQLYEGGRA